VNHIPRFVPGSNYSDSFGFEWLRHARTQYDSTTHTKISEDRFFHETLWDRDLGGELLLEAGSGSGRFTEIAASTGAMVISLDNSAAVEANHASNGHRPNVLILQADLFHLPLRESSFDKVLCIGVLQHTPDVGATFCTLTRYVKPGGRLCIDVYRKRRGFLYLLQTRYLIRPLVAGMPPRRLYALCRSYIDGMWWIASLIHRIPRIGSRINWILLIPDYRDILPLSEEQLKEWAILDAFDILSPVYDSPQYIETVREWFARAGFIDVEVKYGYNGIEGKGKRPGPAPP
jgi:SAM-dependent methyltransferase